MSDELSDARNEEIAAVTSNTRGTASKHMRRNSRAIITLQNWRGTRSPCVSGLFARTPRRRTKPDKLSGLSRNRNLLEPSRFSRRIIQMPC